MLSPIRVLRVLNRCLWVRQAGTLPGVTSTLAYTLMRGIRAERTRQGWTQAQLGERLGWSRKTVMQIEAGDRQLLAHELSDVCRALGVGLPTLLVTVDPADRENLGL